MYYKNFSTRFDEYAEIDGRQWTRAKEYLENKE